MKVCDECGWSPQFCKCNPVEIRILPWYERLRHRPFRTNKSVSTYPGYRHTSYNFHIELPIIYRHITLSFHVKHGGIYAVRLEAELSRYISNKRLREMFGL